MDIKKIKFTKITPLKKYLVDLKKLYKDKANIPRLNSLSSHPCTFSTRRVAEYRAETADGSIYWLSTEVYKNLTKTQLPQGSE